MTPHIHLVCFRAWWGWSTSSGTRSSQVGSALRSIATRTWCLSKKNTSRTKNLTLNHTCIRCWYVWDRGLGNPDFLSLSKNFRFLPLKEHNAMILCALCFAHLIHYQILQMITSYESYWPNFLTSLLRTSETKTESIFTCHLPWIFFYKKDNRITCKRYTGCFLRFLV